MNKMLGWSLIVIGGAAIAVTLFIGIVYVAVKNATHVTPHPERRAGIHFDFEPTPAKNGQTTQP